MNIGPLFAALAGLGVGAGGASLLGGGGSEGPSLEDTLKTINEFFGPGGPFEQKSGQTPSGSAKGGNTEVSYGTKPRVADFSLSPNLLKKIQEGRFGGKKAPGVKKSLQDAIAEGEGKIDFSLLDKFKGLKKKAKSKGIVSGKPNQPDVGFDLSPEAQSIWDTLVSSYSKSLTSQQGINDLITKNLPSLVDFQNSVIGTGKKILDTGFQETDPAVRAKIDAAERSYVDSRTRNTEEKYRRIADSIFTGVAQSGVSGSGTVGAYKQAVTEPLAAEISDITNQAKLYSRDETHKVLEDQRAGFATAGTTGPAYNASYSGINVPQLPVDPYRITGPFDVGQMLQSIQFANQFSQNADQIRRAPGIAGIAPGVAAGAQQGPSVPQAIGSLVGTAIPPSIAAFSASHNPISAFYADLIAKSKKA